MDHTTLVQRDELASDHQLGLLEMQRTPRTFAEWALYLGGILAGCFLIWLAVVSFSGASVLESVPRPLTFETAIFAIGICALVVIPAIIHSFTCSTVYLYTHGLVYLDRHRRGVARWEEIERVVFPRDDSPETSSALEVYLKDGTRIRFLPLYTSRGSASLSRLYAFIHKRVPPARIGASDR